MHVYFIFFIFLYFIFYLFFWGWAQLSPHGLGWTQPARPGQWPKPMTRLGNMKHAWTKSRVHEQIKELKLECTVGSELKWKAGKEKLTYLALEIPKTVATMVLVSVAFLCFSVPSVFFVPSLPLSLFPLVALASVCSGGRGCNQSRG